MMNKIPDKILNIAEEVIRLKKIGCSNGHITNFISKRANLKPSQSRYWRRELLKDIKNKSVKEQLIKVLRESPCKLEEIINKLDSPREQIIEILHETAKTHNIKRHGDLIAIDKPDFGRLSIDTIDSGDWTRIGLVADTHLACKEERLDSLHAQYDLFERESIKLVFHAGNIVDGYIQKINGCSVFCTTIDDQINYVIDNYPQRKNIITYFITGDDHEGWWIKNDGINFGAYLQMCAEKQNRFDLKYLGHIEADVEFKNKSGSIIMKVSHPGMGSAYSRSYQPQRFIEALQGGEKPAILVQGHYHVNNYMFERNVHVVSLPGFQDQTIFARKKRLRMDIGGCIMEFKQNPKDGAITRFRLESTMFFDRGYYRNYLRSDARLVKGHIIVNT